MRKARPKRAALARARPRDLPLIKHWLAQCDVTRWWGSPVENFREMRIGIANRSNEGYIFLIIGKNRQPAGLVSLMHARVLARELDWPSAMPLDAWEIGILIGDMQDRRRGVGRCALEDAQRFLRQRTNEPLFAFIMRSNHASLRCFETLGYRRLGKGDAGLEGWGVDWAVFRYDDGCA